MLMVKVRNNRRGKLNLRFGVQLSRGENDVDPEAWAKCRIDPITRHYLQARDIEVVVSASQVPTAKASTAKPSVAVEVEATPAESVTPKEPVVLPDKEDMSEEPLEPDDEPTNPNGENPVTPEDPARMKAKDVIWMVERTQEEMALKQMLMTEKRPTVRAAIEHRLAELKR